MNEAVDPYCSRDNSKKNWVEGLRWNLGIYITYTSDDLYSGWGRVSFMEILDRYTHFKSGHVREIINVWESDAIAAFKSQHFTQATAHQTKAIQSGLL